jgi:hypothetical protein
VRCIGGEVERHPPFKASYFFFFFAAVFFAAFFFAGMD